MSETGKFKLGETVATQGALQYPLACQEALARHSIGDWGVISEEDRKTNQDSFESWIEHDLAIQRGQDESE